MSETGKELTIFMSCIENKASIKALKERSEISSIYHVCGVNPWFIVGDFESLDSAISLRKEIDIGIKFMSISYSRHYNPSRAPATYSITSWILVKSAEAKASPKTIFDKLSIDGVHVAEVHEIFGENKFVVKLLTKNLTGMDSYVTALRDDGIATSTKCVLFTKKENGKTFKSGARATGEFGDSNTKLQYAMIRIMANTRGFIYKERKEQKDFLAESLRKISQACAEEKVESYMLSPDTDGDEYYRDDLVHPISLIDRYSVKLERPQWIKVLLFFKAASAPDKKNNLEEVLVDKLLGVNEESFARKLYHITGRYDFMVPLDCVDLDVLANIIDDFWADHGDLIDSFTNTVCRNDELPATTSAGGQGRLEVLDIPIIQALLINSTHIKHFEETVRERFAKEVWRPAALGFSPRDDYVRNAFNDKDKGAVTDYLARFSSLGNIGLEPIIEFRDGALIQTLAIFYFTDSCEKEKFKKNIEKKQEKFALIANIYEPVRDPMKVMCILATENLAALSQLLDELGKFSFKTEFHIIFHQKHYSDVVANNVACRPCFYPVKLTEPCYQETTCRNCNNWVRCSQQKCGSCVRYILPRKKERILHIEMGVNSHEELKRNLIICAVGVDLNHAQYFALEKLLDDKAKLKEVLDAYENWYCEDKGGESVMSPEDISNEYKKIGDQPEYRNDYGKAVENIIRHLVDNKKSDVLVFPEYSIPLSVFRKIRAMSIEKDVLIVAGSQVQDGFNVCPLVFCRENGAKEIFYVYKNILNPAEEEFPILSRHGTGHLKFHNTIFGNVYVRICYDGYTAPTNIHIEDVDLFYALASIFPSPFEIT